ncbi:MAG: hypothetical protein RIB60_00055 [Phycisphaerales bacterium]
MPAPDERCPSCGYDLKGQVTTDAFACPECGELTSSRDIRAHMRKQAKRRSTRIALVWALAFAWIFVGALSAFKSVQLIWIAMIPSYILGFIGALMFCNDQKHALGMLRIPAAIIAGVFWIFMSAYGAMFLAFVLGGLVKSW